MNFPRDPNRPKPIEPVNGPVFRPDLLLVGGSGRNSGKTELACRIIARHAPSQPVVGLKVTTVERTDGHCPHGGEGCGVCSSLDRPWIVTREMDSESPKDTCRMLASGARRVHWLRSLRSELVGGATELLEYVPPGWVGVGESTSLRQVVEPGLFILVESTESAGLKPSARAVAHLVDRVVVSDGCSFDLELDRISVVNGRWVLRRDAWAVVTATDDGRPGADLAIGRTRTSLEPEFDRVLVGAEDHGRTRAGVPWTAESGPPPEWFLVTPPLANGVPPGLVGAMFRQRTAADVVVATFREMAGEADLALCRRALVPEVMAAVRWGVDALPTLGDRCTGRRLRWDSGQLVAAPNPRSAATQRAAAEAL
jgi:hypothetical protein